MRVLLASVFFALSAAATPGDQRLIQFNHTGPAECLSRQEVMKLVAERHRAGKPGLGFMDVTHLDQQRVRIPLTEPEYPAAPIHQPEVNALFDILNADGEVKLNDFLQPLSEFHNRYYTSEWARPSSLWIADECNAAIRSAGREGDAAVKLWLNPDFPQMNIVATIAGTDASARDVIIIGSHMDSINSLGEREDWGLQRAPGADDDGSGSAATFHIFNSLLVSDFRPQRTIEFHWYAGEELGLLGSRELAKQYRAQGREVHAMLQLDMCGGRPGGFNFIMDFVSEALSRFEMQLVEEYCSFPYVEGACGYACSDHASWHDEGYPSSFPIETNGAKDPDTDAPCVGHTDDDRLECVDFSVVLDYARLGAAFAVELSYTHH